MAYEKFRLLMKKHEMICRALVRSSTVGNLFLLIFALATRRSPRKNEKKPVFVLNISIAPEEVDNCLEPSKSSIQLSVRPVCVSCAVDI